LSAGDEWDSMFERKIRDLASRSVAHIKRGDTVTIKTSAGERSKGDRTSGADPLLRYLALLEPTPEQASDPKKAPEAAE
jgi:uncharacterized protein (DUF58 family)